MTERKCEVCGASDADNEGRDFASNGGGVEVWSWTDRHGVWRVRCRKHLTRAQRKAPA